MLVARAFNQVYGLGLTTRAEIEAAYQGEIATPSRCGRMDQGCAYGQIPVMMTFDADRLGVQPLRPGGDFHLLIADLCGKKDTVRILADLNDAYPFASTPRDQAVQRCLGPENQRIVSAARAAIEAGDAAALGALMREAQAVFDEHLMPVCEELRSPRLHRVLADPRVDEWAYGGKGVGSQGDGCVQFICRSPAARDALAVYLQNAYGMPCFELDITRPVSVRKAVIPVAGLGTRMFPYTKAVPKTLLPVVTPDGVAKPVIQVIVEEALSAGVEEIALIIQPEDEARTYLTVDRHGREGFFCVNGIYALRPRIFAWLARQAADPAGEIQLTDALEALRQEEGVKGLVVDGRHFDTGIPTIYAETLAHFSKSE